MDFTKLDEYIDSISTKVIPGCDCVVYLKNEPVYRRMHGYRDSAGTAPVSSDDLYIMYSITKVLTCSSVMKLYEDGLIGLDTPVSEYLPSFSSMNVRTAQGLRPAENPITIRHLLTMTAGLDYNIESPSIKAIQSATNGKATTREIVDAIANEPLSFDPGSHYQYSLCHDVLAAVIEVVTGTTFYQHLVKTFFEPLNMRNSFMHINAVDISKMSELYTYDPKNRISKKTDMVNCFAFSRNYESGGAGLICSVDDYIKFASMLACGGFTANGTRLLSANTITSMKNNELSESCFEDFRNLGKTGYSYGLGVRTLIDPAASPSPVGEFGWDGAAGSYVLIDTDNQLSIFYAQHILNCLPAYDKVHPTIRNLVYESLKI